MAAVGDSTERLNRAAQALAERWYSWGPSGPTEHGWMRELAAAALHGADAYMAEQLAAEVTPPAATPRS